MKMRCHNCKWKYSCGYSGCLSGIYNCCEPHLFKESNGKFWSLNWQDEVSEKVAKKHFIENTGFEVVEEIKCQTTRW